MKHSVCESTHSVSARRVTWTPCALTGLAEDARQNCSPGALCFHGQALPAGPPLYPENLGLGLSSVSLRVHDF